MPVKWENYSNWPWEVKRMDLIEKKKINGKNKLKNMTIWKVTKGTGVFTWLQNSNNNLGKQTQCYLWLF